jgi:putative ABC transport system permease protein
VLAIDKELPLFGVASMDDLLAEETADQRFEAAAVGLFAGLALLLAAVGIYGVISYMVSQRTREIGVRMAVGAQRGDVLRMVIRDGMFVTGAGMAVGIGGALALTRLMRNLLFQITPNDPATYLGVTVILATIGLVACWVPGRRAMRIDPMAALRYE